MDRITQWLITLLVSMQLFTACNSDNPSKFADRSVKIDSLLTHLHNEGQFNGAFFLADRQRIIFQQVYGYANIPARKALNNETMFEIASVSKTFTATLIMKLIREGTLDLDSKLIEFFPEMPYEDITVEHLLTHTSGIPFYYDALIKDHWGACRTLNTDTIFQLYAKLKPEQEFAAGQKFSYSNAGYMLLAGIAERATGKSFDQLLETYIFSEAGMQSTKRDVLLSVDDNYALGHQLSVKQGAYVPLSMHEDSLEMLDYFFKDSKGPGGMYAAMGDLWMFSKAIQNNTILNEESTSLMFTPATLADGSETHYGRGWQLTSSDSSRYVHHRGGSEGVNCYYFIALDEGYTYFLVSNTKSFYLSAINKQIRNIIDDKPTEKILKSGFERIALTINTLSEDELMKKVAFIRTHPEEYYLALHEFNELAWKYWIDENYDEAFRIIKLATVAMPDNAGAFEVLAEAYMETGNNDLAIQNYTKTINMLLADPDKKDKKWAKEWIADMQEIIQNINNN